MVLAGRRPVMFGGGIVVSLDWQLGTGWCRIVLPPDTDPATYDLDFLAGLDILLVYRPDHPDWHREAAIAAVRAARPRVCAPVALPHLVEPE